MNTSPLLGLIALLLLHKAVSQAQALSTTHSFNARLVRVHQRMENALVKKDLPQLMRYYDQQAVCMPEFHPTLFTKQAIRPYVQAWLDSANVSQYQCTIYEVQRLNDYLLESGTYWTKLTKVGQSLFTYQGKYLHIWKIGKANKLTLLSQIWGATGTIDRGKLPLSTYVLPDTAAFPHPVANATRLAINSQNQQLASLIVKSDGAAMADLYTPDAVYMPYYMPMLVGNKPIRAYYIEHENPAVGIDTVHIKAATITPVGEYVLVNGYYDVHWHSGPAQGTVTGKSINIWKRDATGSLRLYRQMVCHD